MTIHHETEVVSSSYDAVTRTHAYTIERNGKRWTVTIPAAELEQNGPVMGASAAVNHQRRRAYVATRLQAAMGGEPDA